MKKYLILTIRKPEFQESSIPAHYRHLDRLRAEGGLEMAGPFTDLSGGAYVIKAENFAAAQAIAFADPVHTTGSSEVKVYEWNVS